MEQESLFVRYGLVLFVVFLILFLIGLLGGATRRPVI